LANLSVDNSRKCPCRRSAALVAAACAYSTPSVVIEKSATDLRLGDHADFSI
jgi:hypothetical protein